MDNIAFFNRLTLEVFDRLYRSFPTPTDLDVQAIAMAIVPKGAEKDETWNSLQAADDAVDFLAQEGFLTYKGDYLEGGTFLQVRLTLKGLAILGSTPGSLEGRQPLIDRMRKALAGGAKEAGTETVRQLIQQAFSAAVTAGPFLASRLTGS